ncbi:lipopolysaccharide biosynthesis protein [Mycobacterium sp. AZCC_0083]|uniref:lipopolysaccharide biosynthesis protein n=1 Tax=Mycobacterium sp. AZCC_0083 TaxID=2735882 RepID=UPI001619BE33|nr:polysaccharide biosynthesis C-terminal domain-containing protein [Mycobacterium sp. AZCC_0083]MBB5163306.1 O-antigen/teichoic acid export membrane protein [Mycobacterium sp. AZCC_0083]
MNRRESDGALSRVAERVRQATADPMMRNSLAIMASTVLTSLLGYAFWMIAARHFDRDVNGTAAATTSAIQATVLIASVGAAAALVEWLPRCEGAIEWRQRVTTAMVVSIATAAVGGGVVVGVVGVATSTLPQLATPVGAVLFCLACVFFAVGLVIDYIAVSEHRGGLFLGRNMVLCGLRIPLLFIPVSFLGGADSILLAWTAAAALSLVWALATFGVRDGRSLIPNFVNLVAHLREMASSLVGQHLITVFAMLAGYLLPVVVYSRLSATDNAYFYITWMLGSVFFIISPAVSAALFVEGAADRVSIRPLVRKCVVVVSVLLAIPMLAYLLGGKLILGLFGADYVGHGQLLLLLLTLSAVPDAITNIAVAVLRVTDRMRMALLLNGGMLVACVGAAWLLLPTTGIVGAGVCWLAAQSVGALWVLVSWRRIVGYDGIIDPGLSGDVAGDVLPVAAQNADH